MTSSVPELDLSLTIDVGTTRLLWREQLRELPRAAWYQLRRVFRCEPRQYLVIDGRVVGRFVSGQDHLEYYRWVAETHTRTFDYARERGREAAVAEIHDGLVSALGQPDTDPGDASPA